MASLYIIEPHHDDAIYSLGGIIQQFKQLKNIQCLSDI